MLFCKRKGFFIAHYHVLKEYAGVNFRNTTWPGFGYGEITRFDSTDLAAVCGHRRRDCRSNACEEKPASDPPMEVAPQ